MAYLLENLDGSMQMIANSGTLMGTPKPKAGIDVWQYGIGKPLGYRELLLWADMREETLKLTGAL